MAEIKSAIELAMERTKNLVMDDEEKRAFAQKDLEEKLRAVMRRFLEGMIDREQFLDDYGNIKADKRHKRLLFADLIIQEFEGSAQNERVFALIELVGADAGARFEEEAKALKTRFLKELETREAGIRKSIAGRLHDLGISGSAVEPNAADWDEWKAGAREAASLFRRHLSEWKDRMSAASQ
jgi:hypothetical protein